LEIKGTLQMMKHPRDDDDTTFQKEIKLEMDDVLQQRVDLLNYMEEMFLL
jgi:hypothetical protein